MQSYIVYFICKLLYMFRVVPPPIIRSANICIYNIWYLSHRYSYLTLSRQIAVTVWQIPDAEDTVVCAPDYGWWYHPKHVEQFPDKMNCVTFYFVGHILEQNIHTHLHLRADVLRWTIELSSRTLFWKLETSEIKVYTFNFILYA
jgi:hypothetical protein